MMPLSGRPPGGDSLKAHLPGFLLLAFALIAAGCAEVAPERETRGRLPRARLEGAPPPRAPEGIPGPAGFPVRPGVAHPGVPLEGLQADVKLDLLFIGPLDTGRPCTTPAAAIRSRGREIFQRAYPRFRLLPEERLAEVTGGRQYTPGEYSRDDFRLARELGRRAGADFVYVAERVCGPPDPTHTFRLLDMSDPRSFYTEWVRFRELPPGDVEAQRRAIRDANGRLFNRTARPAITQALLRKATAVHAAARKAGEERPPLILIVEPEPDQVTGSARARLQAIVTAQGEVAALEARVNGEPLALRGITLPSPTVRIREGLSLRLGRNTFELAAVDERGRRALERMELRRAEPPRIELLSPPGEKPLPGPAFRLLARLSDVEGLEEVRLLLNGQPLPLPPPGESKSLSLDRELSLEVGRNEVVIAARSRLGLESRRSLTLVRAAPAGGAPTPPVVLIFSPGEGLATERESVSLTGAVRAVGGSEVAEVSVLVNGSPLRGRDIGVAGKGREFPLKLVVPLRMGENRIEVVARDTAGLVGREARVVRREVARGQIAAVVVGVNAYRKVQPLRYATNDARAFYDYLVADLGVPRDRVKLLLDGEATVGSLRSVLGTWLPSLAGEHDTVLIFFAGHGATENDPASPDGDSLSKYLLPVDADIGDLYGTAFPMDEVARVFSRIRSRRVLFIGDTCYSGASGGRTLGKAGSRAVKLSEGFLERLSKGEGRVILTASGPNELAKEDDTLKHGVFTYHLLQALRQKEADLNGDGYISLSEAYAHVSREVPRATGQTQRPVMKGEVTGEVVLGKVGGR